MPQEWKVNPACLWYLDLDDLVYHLLSRLLGSSPCWDRQRFSCKSSLPTINLLLINTFDASVCIKVQLSMELTSLQEIECLPRTLPELSKGLSESVETSLLFSPEPSLCSYLVILASPL